MRVTQASASRQIRWLSRIVERITDGIEIAHHIALLGERRVCSQYRRLLQTAKFPNNPVRCRHPRDLSHSIRIECLPFNGTAAGENGGPWVIAPPTAGIRRRGKENTIGMQDIRQHNRNASTYDHR